MAFGRQFPKLYPLDFRSQHQEMVGKLGEQFALLWVNCQIADQGALTRALGSIGAQLLQLGLDVSHFSKPEQCQNYQCAQYDEPHS